jgi:hypothetical protein
MTLTDADSAAFTAATSTAHSTRRNVDTTAADRPT